MSEVVAFFILLASFAACFIVLLHVPLRELPRALAAALLPPEREVRRRRSGGRFGSVNQAMARAPQHGIIDGRVKRARLRSRARHRATFEAQRRQVERRKQWEGVSIRRYADGRVEVAEWRPPNMRCG